MLNLRTLILGLPRTCLQTGLQNEPKYSEKQSEFGTVNWTPYLFINKRHIMKRTYFQKNIKLNDNSYLYVNFLNMSFMLLPKSKHEMIECNDLHAIEVKDNNFYNELLVNKFIADDDFDEFGYVELNRKLQKYDTSIYQLIINPTLDCNMSCWYCYEKKVCNSAISHEIVEAIKKNIALHDSNKPFRDLRLSFFGGEPFLCFKTIEELSEYSYHYCIDKGKNLILDFTTNGTLVTDDKLVSLSKYHCVFQITLDGNREQHNKIKFLSNKRVDTFQKTIDNINAILSTIPNSFVFIRLNFNERTLRDFDDILEQLKPFDRKRVKIILKKVWQVNTDIINKKELMNVIQKLFDNSFIVDYYTQGGLCFGEQMNEVVINYDGQVFKCTTIEEFNKENSFGHIDIDTGSIVWDKNKVSILGYELISTKCKKCKLYPTCYGPCTFHLLANQDDCYLKSLNLTLSEYILFMFKNEIVRQTVFGK